jgi:hypothetical protein
VTGQLEEVAKIIIQFQDKTEILTRCFFLFSGWRIIRWRIWKTPEGNYFFFKKAGCKAFCITSDLFTELVKKISWITEGFCVPSYVPAIEGFRTPNLLLYNVTVEQFLATDNFYFRFVKTGEVKQLDCMLASLYCDSFESLEMDIASETMGRREYFRRFAAFLWYSGVKAWLKQKYPYVFVSSNEEQQGDPDTNVMNLLTMLNGGDITRNGSILKTPVHQALFELNQKIENSNRRKNV